MLDQRKYEDVFGHLVPYIRIKDYILKRDEIIKFSLDTSGFLPTISLHVASMTKSLVRENLPVDGDRISIGIRQDKTTFEPIASDFIVTSVTSSPQKDTSNSANPKKRGYYELFITGKLFIPNLDTGINKYTYTGLAEDALRDMAIRLGLGYVHTKNTKTLKKESWHCYYDPLEFIQNVTSHMWLGKDSFFDSWIDARRNLTVVNVNDILGRKLSDDGELDFTKYKNVNGSVGEDGKYVNNDLMALKDSKFPKMYCNDPQFEETMWYPINYRYVNNSTNVSKAIGPQRNFEVYLQNNGVGQSVKEAKHTIEIGVWYMQEKLDLGYVIANGPTNYVKDFKQADNGKWKDQNTKTFSPILMPVESDGDDQTKESDQSNLNVSGNFSKEYIIAPEHNQINLAELDKQLVIITTYGANLGIVRGEKVPCFLYNRSNEKWVSETRNTQDTTFEFDMVCSGWFYVKGVELVYQPDWKPNNFLTDWKTIVTLTRREWFPPESTATKKEAEFGILAVDVAKGNSVESVSSSSSDTEASKMPTVESSTPMSMSDALSGNNVDQISSAVGSVAAELGGMADEFKDNVDSFAKTQAASGVLGSISSMKAVVEDHKTMIENVKNSLNMSVTAGLESGVDLSSLKTAVPTTSGVKTMTASEAFQNASKTIENLEKTQKELETKLNSITESMTAKSQESIKSGIALGEDDVASAKAALADLTSGSEALLSSISSASSSLTSVLNSPSLSNVSNLKNIASDLSSSITSKVDSVKSSISNAKATASNIASKLTAKNEGEISQKDTVQEAESKESEKTFEEAMSYDGNGLKHFMNEFLNVMNSEGIGYTLLGARRWAVDKKDKKVYGNAFVMRQTSEIYKTLDSDGELYWLSDYNSRHYYGEAVDISPSGTFDKLLEDICLSDKVLDCMHKYGICLQLEVSHSGHSKGTHFHCSTDQTGAQTKWWGIVNKRRANTKMKTYTVIIKGDYYEEETKNEIVLA